MTFQLCLGEKTLFEKVKELLPAHYLIFNESKIQLRKYWEIYYEPDFTKSSDYFKNRFKDLLEESVRYHVVSDVPLGGYVSGGYDSSSLAVIASRILPDDNFIGFTGKFSEYGEKFDESRYAKILANKNNFSLKTKNIIADDFKNNINKVIYHLDYPVAGPGSFSQYIVSELAAAHRKVVIGGQGGDEILGDIHVI